MILFKELQYREAVIKDMKKNIMTNLKKYSHIITEVLRKDNNTLMREIAENTPSNLFAAEVLGKSATDCKKKEERVDFLLISRIHQVLNMD